MYVYCGNDPVNRVDPEGCFWQEIWDFVQTAVKEIGNVFATQAPVYSAAGGAAVLDGPLPFGDILLGGLILAGIGQGVYEAAKSIVNSLEDAKEDVATHNSLTFPTSPNDFNPIGLIRVDRVGTKNGALITWMDPHTGNTVFRWDENPNFSDGPHYHISDMGHNHYYSGDIIPEPYASIYFLVR